MSAAQDQIKFMSERGISDRTISGMTGIPRSTIGFVRRGERGIPSEYAVTLRDNFRKVNYHSLRRDGMSYHQARKYSSQKSSKAEGILVEMRMLVTQLTRGAVTRKVAKLEKEGIIPNMKKIASDMLEKVKAGLRKSYKDFDTQKDYMFRKQIKELEDQEKEAEQWGGWFE